MQFITGFFSAVTLIVNILLSTNILNFRRSRIILNVTRRIMNMLTCSLPSELNRRTDFTLSSLRPKPKIRQRETEKGQLSSLTLLRPHCAMNRDMKLCCKDTSGLAQHHQKPRAQNNLNTGLCWGITKTPSRLKSACCLFLHWCINMVSTLG